MVRIFSLLMVVLLTGCVAGQQIKFGDLPISRQAESLGIPVTVKVKDNRNFVQIGNKSPAYIGHYRAGFGNTWDVNTYQNKALAEIFSNDLERELKSLGFTAHADQTGKKLQVVISDWNFDTYMNGKIWYDIEMAVYSKDNEKMIEDRIKENKVIKGSFWVGAKYAFEEEVPKIYADIIRRLLRENEKVLLALRQ